MACITEGCPGTISYCALQQGPEASPQELTVLVQHEKEDRAKEKEKERHSKPKRKDESKKHRKQDNPQPSGWSRIRL